MSREKFLVKSHPLFLAIVGKTDIELFIYSLELGVETANNHVLESVGLHLCPCIDLVRRDILNIACNIV